MAERPIRVQLSRRKGWRMPPDTVSVARPGKWGNPFVASDNIAPGKRAGGFYIAVPTVEDAVACFREMLTLDGPTAEGSRASLPELRGKNLACWCELCDAHKDGKPLGVECADCSPCHADVLLDLANAEPDSTLSSEERGPA